MTLIITLGNSDQFIQISDRRLTVDGELKDDESNKAGVLYCKNARLAYGFTGLARAGNFDTKNWLLKALSECSPPDYLAQNILERLKERATNDFKTIPPLKRVPQSSKRLSIMFSGYLYHNNPPRGVFAILSNFQDFSFSIGNGELWDEFKCTYYGEKRPSNEEFSVVQRVGIWPARKKGEVASLRKLLVEHKPVDAIIGKATALMSDLADRPEAGNTIGKQLSTIILPRDNTLPAKVGYHSNVVADTIFYPDMVNLGWILSNASVSSGSASEPLMVPKVGRNEPCPCKSGKKYKKCHGVNR